MTHDKAKAMQCWRLIDADRGLPTDSHLKIGTVARFLNGKPTEAVWVEETSDWSALRWEKCDDPLRVTA